MASLDFKKGEFKIKNTNNWTTEQVKDTPFKYIVDGGQPTFIGTITHADEEYLYGNFHHNSDKDIMLVFTPNESTIFSMEIEGE